MMDLPGGNKQQRIWYHENKSVLQNMRPINMQHASSTQMIHIYKCQLEI